MIRSYPFTINTEAMGESNELQAVADFVYHPGLPARHERGSGAVIDPEENPTAEVVAIRITTVDGEGTVGAYYLLSPNQIKALELEIALSQTVKDIISPQTRNPTTLRLKYFS